MDIFSGLFTQVNNNNEEDLRVELQNMKPGEGVIRAEVGPSGVATFKKYFLQDGKLQFEIVKHPI
ncbi:ATPase [Caenorhabditis elegans]|uniref:ATPase n=1 Tax=Caenorhabditis elegans TaxID=6239 RepID=O02070_CAEEL|nr:ATPase [Caenorhabditis elegans]CCD69694.3 ATPase [Caenorhabditis elegans]|eukprot:NP_494608.3 Uncharacterized protein CELE_F19B10.3 [Caenorhabditis elegans]